MSYPWPATETPDVLDQALDIALGYLERAGRAFPLSETRRICAEAILVAWRKGTKHKLRLANSAIVTMETKAATSPPNLQSFYPRIL
jgi:hypothetical protein